VALSHDDKTTKLIVALLFLLLSWNKINETPKQGGIVPSSKCVTAAFRRNAHVLRVSDTQFQVYSILDRDFLGGFMTDWERHCGTVRMRNQLSNGVLGRLSGFGAFSSFLTVKYGLWRKHSSNFREAVNNSL